MSTGKRHILVDIADNAGLDIRSYSGRGMMGAKCLAIDTDAKRLFVEVLKALRNGINEEYYCPMDVVIESIEKAFQGMREDSMGRGSITYFPGVPFEEEEDTL